VPSLVVEGEARPILHVSQVAGWLGFERPDAGEALAAGWDLAAALDRWLERVEPLELSTLTAPVPAARGRSLRTLTVNVFHPVELLPAAFREGRFDWDPDGDDERERALETAEALRVYAGRIAAAWTSFLLDDEEALRAHDPLVRSPRGDVRYGELLDAQRWHASFHLRQLETALAGR
jgi:hypothetical protein